MDPIEHSAIHSRENARFKLIRSLNGSKGVKKHGLSLLGGRRLIAECLTERPESAEFLVCSGNVSEAFKDIPGFDPDKSPGIRTIAFVPELFRELDFLGAGSPFLVVRVPEIAAWSPDSGETGGLTVFLPLSDPENLGAAIRSCAAFAVDRIVLLAEAAHPFHPRALRSAAGQTWRTPLFAGPELSRLATAGLSLLALDMDGTDLSSLPNSGDLGLVVGEEGPGLPKHLDCRRVRIPIQAGVESLNAGVALGIALYHLRRI